MNSDDERYTQRENQWDQQWPAREREAGAGHPPTELDNLDETLPFPEEVGTSDVIESVRDAEPYMAPIDPPVLPGGRENIHTATGFGVDVEEENFAEPLPRGDEDIHDLALLTLRQDSLTSRYPLEVAVRDGVVHLRGQVPSVEDAEHAQWILGELAGVVDVVDDTTVVPTMVQ